MYFNEIETKIECLLQLPLQRTRQTDFLNPVDGLLNAVLCTYAYCNNTCIMKKVPTSRIGKNSSLGDSFRQASLFQTASFSQRLPNSYLAVYQDATYAIFS